MRSIFGSVRLPGRKKTVRRRPAVSPRRPEQRPAGKVAPAGQGYLDPAVLSRFRLTPLLARRVVEGFITGLHKSPFHGFSVEFADYREYVPGDDLKYLDWYLYARTDHYYIKRFEEETNLRCYLLMDHSASMGFGTGALTKWDYSCFLAACLAYLMLRQQDAVGMALFGRRPGLFVPPRGRQTQLGELTRLMLNHPPAGRTDIASSILGTLRNLKRRGLVVVISDLIDEPEKTARAIRLLSGHKHDVIVFHVQDPAEIDFPFEGAVLFRDMETGEEIELNPAAARARYLEEKARLDAFYRKTLLGAGIDYVPLRTTQPYEQAFAEFLRRRELTRK